MNRVSFSMLGLWTCFDDDQGGCCCVTSGRLEVELNVAAW